HRTFFSLPGRVTQSRGKSVSVRLTRLRCTVPPHSGQERAVSFSFSAAVSAQVTTLPGRLHARTPRTSPTMAAVPPTASQRRSMGLELMLMHSLLVRRDLDVVVEDLGAGTRGVDGAVGEPVDQWRPLRVGDGVLDLERPGVRLLLASRPDLALDDALAAL